MFVKPSDEQIIRYWVLAIKNCISKQNKTNQYDQKNMLLINLSLIQIVINDYLPLCLVELYPAIS